MLVAPEPPHPQRRSARLRRWAMAMLVAAPLLASASVGRAFTSLFDRIGRDAALARSLPESLARARVEEGFLLGTGSERITRKPDGSLRIERTRRYTQVRDPDNHRVATLPEPWQARSDLVVTPDLRLARIDTRLDFKRSGDTALGGEKLSERFDWLFRLDRSVAQVTADGKHIVLQTFLGTKRLRTERYDYPQHAVPLELIGLFLSVAVQRHIDSFDFDLLLPGGSVHGVRAKIHRTRDLRRFAEGYRLPAAWLRSAQTLAVVDMRLASPVKYLFFPHHFYMAYAQDAPSRLMLMWGGDPDENLQAFRID